MVYGSVLLCVIVIFFVSALPFLCALAAAHIARDQFWSFIFGGLDEHQYMGRKRSYLWILLHVPSECAPSCGRLSS